MNLPPLAGNDWMSRASETRELVTVPINGRPVSFVKLSGNTDEFGETFMLAAVVPPQTSLPAGHPSIGDIENPNTSSDRTQSKSSSPLTYELPEGWVESAGSSMRLVSAAVPGDSGKADFSVIRLGGGGDDLGNVNRWRGQVGLEPIDQQELEQSTDKVTVSGQDGYLVAIEGAEQSTLAAAVGDGAAQWFFKLTGPTNTVMQQREQFQEFLSSVKFEGNQP